MRERTTSHVADKVINDGLQKRENEVCRSEREGSGFADPVLGRNTHDPQGGKWTWKSGTTCHSKNEKQKMSIFEHFCFSKILEGQKMERWWLEVKWRS